MNPRQRFALALLVCGGLMELAAVGGHVAVMEYSYLDARDIRQNLMNLLGQPGVTNATVPPWTKPEPTLLYVVAIGGLATIALGVGAGLWPQQARAEAGPSKAPLRRDWSEQAVT